MPETPELSFVIPSYNEQDNLRTLIAAIREAVEPLKLSYEVVITDDCSKDKSWEILKELAASDPRIRAQKFAFNCGESAASFAGLKAARGNISSRWTLICRMIRRICRNFWRRWRNMTACAGRG